MAKVKPRKTDGEHPFLRLIESVQEAENLRLARKLDRARAVCATVLKEEPEYVAALFTMGLILADQSQFEKAVGYLHRALMFNPHDPKILTALSGVYIRLGSSLMAARTLEQARKISPDDPNILITLGEIYREEKEYEFAKDAYERALAVDPTRVDAEMGLAQNLNAECKKLFLVCQINSGWGLKRFAGIQAHKDGRRNFIRIGNIPIGQSAYQRPETAVQQYFYQIVAFKIPKLLLRHFFKHFRCFFALQLNDNFTDDATRPKIDLFHFPAAG